MKSLVSILLLLLGFNVQAQFSNENYSSEEVGKMGLTEIRFVGSGNIQLAMETGEDLAASTGLGAIFWRIWPNEKYGHVKNNDILENMSGLELQLEVKINVASTADTISALYNINNSIVNRRSFGNYILAPLSSGQATTINSLWYLKPKSYNKNSGVTKRKLFFIPFIDGIELSAAATNQVWTNNSISSNVSILAWRSGIFHEFLSDPIRRMKGYSIRFGASYTGRSIQGDVGREETFRFNLLGNEAKTYHGMDFTLSLRLQNIRAEATLPVMHIGSKMPVSGLSGSQFVTSISFVGGFPLALTGN